MSDLKWFSGGKDRKEEAVTILELLIASHSKGKNPSQPLLRFCVNTLMNCNQMGLRYL